MSLITIYHLQISVQKLHLLLGYFNMFLRLKLTHDLPHVLTFYGEVGPRAINCHRCRLWLLHFDPHRDAASRVIGCFELILKNMTRRSALAPMSCVYFFLRSRLSLLRILVVALSRMLRLRCVDVSYEVWCRRLSQLVQWIAAVFVPSQTQACVHESTSV